MYSLKSFCSSYSRDIVELRETIKKLAVSNPTTALCRIIANAKRDFPVEVLQALPSEEILANNIRRIRIPDGFTTPTTREEIQFDDNMTKCFDGSEFLYADSNDDRRILVWTTTKNLQVD